MSRPGPAVRERGPLRRLFRIGVGRPGVRDAVEWEIEHHLEEMCDRLIAEGWDPQEARFEAERRFGRVDAYRRALEQIERRRWRTMRWSGVLVAARETVWTTIRSSARQPGLTAVVALTLGIGVGANATMFGILDRILFRPPAHVVDHERIRRVIVERTFSSGERFRQPIGTYPDVLDLRAHSGFGAVAAYDDVEMTHRSGAQARKVRVVLAEHALFPLLGVSAARGRFFGAEDDRPGADPVAVVSHEYWEATTGGDPAMVGSSLELDGTRFTVVGVAPAGFTGAEIAPVDVWIPLHVGGDVRLAGLASTSWRENRGVYWLGAVARLQRGVGLEAAAEEATALHRAGRAEQIHAGRYDPEVRLALDPLILARGPEAAAPSRVARWLGGVSLLLLVIVCANVANLLLARGTGRVREVAVRLALGVSRSRLVAGTLFETALLGLVGSAVGVAFAVWGGAAVRARLLPDVHFSGTLGLRVIAFTLGVAVIAGTVSGVAPALQATRLDLTRDLASGARGAAGGSPVRELLTVGQAALSVLLLVGAGLFIKSVQQLRVLDLGLDQDRLLNVKLEFETGNRLAAEAEPSLDRAEQNRIYREAMGRVASVPGVSAVTATSSPFRFARMGGVEVPGWDSLSNLPVGGPYVHDVTPGYFEAIGQRVVHGRGFLMTDAAGAEPVAVVSETMARTLWTDGEALGACMFVRDSRTGEMSDTCTTVIGIAEDASRGLLTQDPHMTYYLPMDQQQGRRLDGLYVRADEPDVVVPAIAIAMRALGPRVRFAEVSTLQDMLEPQTRSWALGAALFTVFAALALAVAGIGLYGVLAFHVAQRTRELGIRSALGATRLRLLTGVLRDGVRITVMGLAAGLAVSFALGRLAEPLLFRVSAHDPAVFAGVAATLLAVGLAASLLPGARATRIDPMRTLGAD
jgi:predicted permease